MKKIKYIAYLAVASIILLQTACKKDEISSFSAKPAVNFSSTVPVSYSFLGNPETEYVQEIEVKIMGDAADHDRHFKVAVVNDASTTAQSNQYRIIDGIVKAGEYKGKLSIALINSEELNTTTVTLKVKMIDSDDFKAGNIENSEFTVSWTNLIVVPSWSYYRYFFTTAGSENAYRIIVETTGLKTLTVAEFRTLGQLAVETMATQFGDYVKQWNKDHPTDHLKHDSGTLIGQDIVPLLYTHSKFD